MVTVLKIKRFGAFGVFTAAGDELLLGAKHQALMALLVTAENGIRTRAFLENTLWSFAQPEQAKASLRTALSTLRRHIGYEASQLLSANRERVIFNLDHVEMIDDPSKGAFMEGFELPHEAVFADWITEVRKKYRALDVQGQASREATSYQRKYVTSDALLPSIAVLPFAHRTPGEAETSLGSIVAEELSRQLSRSQAFSVMSFLASQHLTSVDLRATEISQFAQVNYLVSGGVCLRGDNLIVQVDLHDAQRETVIWSREFQGSLSNVMMGSSTALRDVTGQIGQTVVGEAIRLVGFKPLSNLDNHTLLMAAIVMMQSTDLERFNKAHEVLTTLMEREAQHPAVLAWAGIWHVIRVQRGLSQDRGRDRLMAENLAETALVQDPAFALAHTLRGMIYSHLTFDFASAEASYDLALRDNPNEALALLMKGATRALQGETAEAIALTEKARRLSPIGPQRYYFDSFAASVNLAARDYERAIELADRSLEDNAVFPSSLSTKAIALQLSGRTKEARDVVVSLLRSTPSFSITQYMEEAACARSALVGDWVGALREAGVPD